MAVACTKVSPLLDDHALPRPVLAAPRRAAPLRPVVDIERLADDLGDLADAHRCPTCDRSPAHRFELLCVLGARLQPDARDGLELIELAGHLAWTGT